MNDWIQDLRLAWRVQTKTPVETGTAVLTLAIGVATTTTIFSVVHANLLQPLPFLDSESLVEIQLRAPRFPIVFTKQEFQLLESGLETLDDLQAYRLQGEVLVGQQDSFLLSSAGVSEGMFEMLGVRPLPGRGFLARDTAPGSPFVAILSFETWKTV